MCKTKSQNRFAWADCLKIFAIIAVIFTHNSEWTNDLRFMYGLRYYIEPAVPIFMILSGFFAAKSYTKTGMNGYYSLQKLVRYTLPLICYLLAEFAILPFTDTPISLMLICQMIFLGGRGPGSYYFLVLTQIVLIAPLLVELIQRKKVKGLVICAVINLAFDIFSYITSMNLYSWKHFSFRYIFLVACGIYFYFYGTNIKICKKTIIPLFASIALGIIFLEMPFRTSIFAPIFEYFAGWVPSLMMSAFWTFPILILFYSAAKNLKPFKLQIIGQASYHIYIFQMFYFWCINDILPIPSLLINFCVDIFICVTAGLIFYKVESRLEKVVLKYLPLLKHLRIAISFG